MKIISRDQLPENAVEFSQPCLMGKELWIIENMAKDMEAAGKSYAVTRQQGMLRGKVRDYLILWKIL
jgi:hypothetical protein